MPLDFKVGESPSLKSYIIRPDQVPGGAKTVSDLFEGPDSADFKPVG